MAVNLLRLTTDVVPELRYATSSKRVRASRAGQEVVDTTSALLVWEPRRVVPEYAVPAADLLVQLRPTHPCEQPARLPKVLLPGNFGWHTAPGTPMAMAGSEDEVAFRPDNPALGGRVILDFAAFDWAEEDEPVMGHPHDPFQRIDCLRSNRHVVVRLGATVIAESSRAVALFETHLPTRWYIPRQDLRAELFSPSDTRTVCAYKGLASYLSADLDGGEDIAWFYPEPLHDAEPVRDLVCFWSERCEVSVDGHPVTDRVTGV